MVKFQFKYAHVVLGYMAMLDFAKMLLKVELWTVIKCMFIKMEIGEVMHGTNCQKCVDTANLYTCKG